MRERLQVAPWPKGKRGTIGELETQAFSQGYQWIIGVDEAGRGPLAGPVVAAAVLLKPEDLNTSWISEVDDSKCIAEGRRISLSASIWNDLPCGVSWVTHEEIDRINILQATLTAMANSVRELIPLAAEQQGPGCILVDGNQIFKWGRDSETTFRDSTYAVVKGDQRSIAIASAGIVAKVTRDRYMCEDADVKWPQYGFRSHKGYGTIEHRNALREYGPCPIHRKSFKGVKDL